MPRATCASSAPTLDDLVDLAGVVLDAPEEAIRRLPRLALAESALAAPFASFGGADAYPTLTEQAAVLMTHRADRRWYRRPRRGHDVDRAADVALSGVCWREPARSRN